jgi:tRNA(Ile)-lysidine synthase
MACIATGHTRDDQAETFLLRLLRGSGLLGLGGIFPVRSDGVVRPLLELSREELLEYLRRSGIPFRKDRSNRDLRHLRNRIRRRVIPFLEREIHPGVSAVLARTAEICREDDTWMDRLSTRATHRLTQHGNLEIAGLQRLPLAEQRRVIRHWLAGVRGSLRQITAAHVEAVRLVAGSDGKQVSWPGGSIRSSGQYLVSEPFRAPVSFSKRLAPGVIVLPGGWEVRRTEDVSRRRRPGPWRALFDGELLKGGLRVRTVKNGDRVRPLGLGGTRKLQDIFVDRKIPREERSRWVVVTAGRVIVWVPGLVRGELAPVTGKSAKIVMLEASHDIAAQKLLC